MRTAPRFWIQQPRRGGLQLHTLTSQFQIGYASAVAVVLAIILVAASAFYVRHLARTVLKVSA
jgi:ABC-type sugar transport system permease subunit